MKYLLSIEDIEFYVNYIFNETSTPLDEVEWLIRNLNEEGKRELKRVINSIQRD